MRVLNRLDISGSLGLGSTSQDQFIIGSPNLENNDISTDTLKVWANADFKNNVTLGSNSSDTIYVSGTLINQGTASLTGNLLGTSSYATNADTVDNLHASSFARIDTTNTFTQNQTISASLFVSGASSVDANSSLPALRVTQAGIGPSFFVEDQTSPDSTGFVIDTSGNVGIGYHTASTYTGGYRLTVLGGINSSATISGDVVQAASYVRATSATGYLSASFVSGSRYTASNGYYGRLFGTSSYSLDSDKLDGYDSSQFAILSIPNTFTQITASDGFSGSGQNLTFLTASSMPNFISDVRKQISGTGVISYDNSTGIITYTGAGGDIYTDGNITGSGTSGNPIRTKENITGSTVTASVGVSSSYFYGDGSNLTGLPTPDLLLYALSSDVSSSFALKTDVTSAIANFPTRIEVTSALSPYALSSAVSSSFITYTEITNSVPRLSANNTFTGINSFGVITGSNGFFTGDLKINGTASIGFLNTINQQSLNIGDKYIIILSGAVDHPSLDSSGILWGSGAIGEATQGPLGEMAYVRFYAANDQLEIFPGLKVSGSLTASAASNFTQITASTGFSGGIFTGTTVSASTGLTGSNLLVKNLSEFDGGVRVAYVAKTGNYTLTASSDYVVSFSGSSLTGTLPNASNIQGTILVVKNLHTSSVFVTSSTARIDGSATGVFINGQYTSYTFLSDNTNWLII